MHEARKIFRMQDTLHMRRGGLLEGVEIAYETWGELNAARSNAILIFTGLSPSAHAASSVRDTSAGWWEDMIGPGKPFDSRRFHIVCFNALGSCYGSTGPASKNPATGERYRLSFPLLSLEDIATCGALLLDHLEVERVAAAVGPSMGGMTALAFCMLHPGRARHLVSISSATRAMPFAIALRSLQRELVRSDPLWNGGDYSHERPPVTGMRLARKLGMITYRSAEEWRQRFGRERIAQSAADEGMFGAEFEVESYLRAHANKFTGEFDPNCYLYLSHAMDLFDVAEHGCSLESGIGLLDIDGALIMGVPSDFLFPLWQQEELAQLIRHAGRHVEYHALESIQGHDSFLVDMDRFRPPVFEYLRGIAL